MADPVPTTTTPNGNSAGGIIAQILDLVHGAQGRDVNRGNTAAGIADPFSGQRGQYQDALAKLLGGGDGGPGYTSSFTEKTFDPGTYQQSPGYTFGLDQGLNAVNSKGNAMFGTTRAGNTATELTKFGTGYAQGDYDKWRDAMLKDKGLFNSEQDAQRTADIQRNQLFNNKQTSLIDALLTASGAKTGNPAAAADAYLKGYANNDKTLGSGLSGGLLDGILGLLGKGAGSIFDFLTKPNGDPNFGTSTRTPDADEWTPETPSPDPGPIPFGEE